jgi:xanthine dehydrogenase YagS FAD-binding subunit
VEAFFTPLGNALEKGELVKEVRIPNPPAGCRQAFLKFTDRRPIDFAVASVAAALQMQDARCAAARIFLGGVAPMPWRAVAAEQCLVGKNIGPSTAEEAARASVSGARPLRGNACKVEIVKTLVTRALLS